MAGDAYSHPPWSLVLRVAVATNEITKTTKLVALGVGRRVGPPHNLAQAELLPARRALVDAPLARQRGAINGTLQQETPPATIISKITVRRRAWCARTLL